jgi:hypothetical protein
MGSLAKRREQLLNQAYISEKSKPMDDAEMSKLQLDSLHERHPGLTLKLDLTRLRRQVGT